MADPTPVPGPALADRLAEALPDALRAAVVGQGAVTTDYRGSVLVHARLDLGTLADRLAAAAGEQEAPNG